MTNIPLDLTALDLADDPLAIDVVSVAVPIQVTFARCDGVLQTHEGPVAYGAGDALMTGPADDRWPITRQQFEVRYAAIAPTRTFEDGLYEKRENHARARRMDRAFVVLIGVHADALHGQAGDWLVQDDPDQRRIVQHRIFFDRYRRIG